METTSTVSDLESLLHELKAETPIPHAQGADVTNNPIDIYRSYIANAVSKIVTCNVKIAYDAVQWTKSLAAGDLVVVVPRLRLKGANPQEFAKDIASKLSYLSLTDPPTASDICWILNIRAERVM